MNTSTKLVLQAIKNFPPQMSWHYAQAFLMLAIYESAKRENDEEIISWVKNKFDALILDNGDILGYNPEDFNLDDTDKLYYARNNADKKVNQALSVVGEKIGLRFTLAFHSARHSFAMNALNDGLSLSVVSRFLGHSSTDITELIYADYLPKKLADELESLHYDYVPNFDD